MNTSNIRHTALSVAMLALLSLLCLSSCVKEDEYDNSDMGNLEAL